MTMDLPWFIGVLLSLQAIGGAIIWFLLQKTIGLHGEKASLQAEGAVRQGEISKLEIENSKLKESISELEKTIKEKYSDDAILAKYDLKEDIAIHRETKRSHCLGCLMKRPRQEVVLIDSGSYWSCPVERQNHDSPNKPNRSRGSVFGGYEGGYMAQ